MSLLSSGQSPEKARFNLSRWAIAHPSIARFLFGLIIVMGALGVMNMGQKEDPDFTFRVMVVQTVWPGSSIQEMQDQVVNKIERKLQETPHLDWVKSYTRAGVAITTVQIKGDTNTAEVKDAFYQVRKKIGDINQDLPAGLLGPYFNDEFGDTYITLNSISGDGYSYPELKQFAIQARDMLLATPGVEKAVILGDQPQKIFIDVSSKALAERGLTALSIRDALAGQNNIDPAGNVQTSDRSVRISVEGGVTTPEDIRELRLKAGDQVIRLGDIATVTDGLETPTSASFASTVRTASRSASSWRPGSRSPMSATRSKPPISGSSRRCRSACRSRRFPTSRKSSPKRSANSPRR